MVSRQRHVFISVSLMQHQVEWLEWLIFVGLTGLNNIKYIYFLNIG